MSEKCDKIVPYQLLLEKHTSDPVVSFDVFLNNMLVPDQRNSICSKYTYYVYNSTITKSLGSDFKICIHFQSIFFFF